MIGLAQLLQHAEQQLHTVPIQYSSQTDMPHYQSKRIA
jgi:hypothetical protein